MRIINPQPAFIAKTTQPRLYTRGFGVSMASRRGGFTMTELMVSIGIIITIASIALPVILAAKRNGTKARVKSDLALLDTAIASYKSDFGDIPRFSDAVTDQAADNSGTQGGGQWLDYASDRGARLLCFSLIAPGPGGTGSFALPGQDGADGPGFRGRRSLAGGSGPLQGKVYGPYIQSDKFKLEYDTTGTFTNQSDAKILDVNGTPILYYPALPGIPKISNNGAYVAAVDPKTAGPATPKPLYNAIDNLTDSTPAGNSTPFISESAMRMLMNADPNTGAAIALTPATYTGPYILWTAGLDGKFGVDAAGKTDDIANFDFPAQMRK